ncbi:MAG TPA: methyltransferase domain-containing protein [Allosphingosinicella sp.]|nr:methyltransferase domain-containing protein [Allosphingosinicella sp.]
MDADQLRAEIARLGPWHHDVEVAPGIRTGDPPPPGLDRTDLGTSEMVAPEGHLRRLVGNLFESGLAGRSFLDCGCNGGGYVYAAKALGAGRVFGFDAREHWIEQARFLGRHLPSDGVELAVCDLAGLREMRPEPFDVTLFNGLFYHLPDPIAGLRVAADLTRELIIVNTATMPGEGDALILSPESKVELMSGVDGLAWLPTNEKVLAAILAWCGFPHWRISFDYAGTVPGWRRLEILAARDESVFARWDSVDRPQTRPSRSQPSRLRRAARNLLRRRQSQARR